MKGMPCKCLLSLFLSFVACSTLRAQADLVVGDTFPATPTKKTWYYNPAKSVIYAYDGARWNPNFTNVKHAYLCAGSLVVETSSHHPNMALMSLYDGAFHSQSQVAYCGEGLAIYETPTQFDFVDAHARLLYRVYRNKCTYEVDTHIVQGMAAFCIPKVHEKLYNENCEEVHTWGMLGTHGQWLIEPQFDGPFYFRDGIAEVLYYGQRRKINEKGEFVD